MSNERKTVWHHLGVAAVALASVFGTALLATVVARDLWAWFVTPTWGVAAPALSTLYGLSMLARVLHPAPIVKSGDESAGSEAVWRVVGYAFGLGFTWLVGLALAGAT